MKRIHNSKRGFTLVEMMLALAIITIIGWTTVALMMAIRDGFMTTYNTNDSSDYAVLYGNGFENTYLKHTQDNTDATIYVDPADATLKWGTNDTDVVFKPSQMKTTNRTTHNVVDKWIIRMYFHADPADYSRTINYKVVILDNYYTPNKIMCVYEGSCWAPHMDYKRVSMDNSNGGSGDTTDSQIRTSCGLDSTWYTCLKYTHG